MITLTLTTPAATSEISATNANGNTVIVGFLEWALGEDGPALVAAMSDQEKADEFLSQVRRHVKKKALQRTDERVRADKAAEIAAEIEAANVDWA